jgi:hypothetical protein
MKMIAEYLGHAFKFERLAIPLIVARKHEDVEICWIRPRRGSHRASPAAVQRIWSVYVSSEKELDGITNYLPTLRHGALAW